MCRRAGNMPSPAPFASAPGRALLAHPLARVRIADGAEWGVRDALLTNAEWERGDAHIEVSGGIWDGNCRHVRRAAEG